VIDTQNPQNALRALVVDAKRRHRPSANDLAGRESVRRTIERLRGESLHDGKNVDGELSRGGRIPFGNDAYSGVELVGCLR
jgi:hypothetical protein